MRVWGYCHVSSEGQATEGVSLDAQRARIKAWCATRGAELIHTHMDAGISGYPDAGRGQVAHRDRPADPPAGAGRQVSPGRRIADHGLAIAGGQEPRGLSQGGWTGVDSFRSGRQGSRWAVNYFDC